jgi:hypothetical protein
MVDDPGEAQIDQRFRDDLTLGEVPLEAGPPLVPHRAHHLLRASELLVPAGTGQRLGERPRMEHRNRDRRKALRPILGSYVETDDRVAADDSDGSPQGEQLVSRHPRPLLLEEPQRQLRVLQHRGDGDTALDEIAWEVGADAEALAHDDSWSLLRASGGVAK